MALQLETTRERWHRFGITTQHETARLEQALETLREHESALNRLLCEHTAAGTPALAAVTFVLSLLVEE